MPENKRVKISSVVKNQLPDFIKADFPLAGEFLAQYYTALEGQGSTLDVLQNIDTVSYTHLTLPTKRIV